MSQETPWFQHLTTESSKDERRHISVWVGRILALLVLLVVVGWATKAYADPIFRAEEAGTVVTLYDEDCKLPEVVNLKKRATWTEKGQTFEGCYGFHPPAGVLMAYFADKTVVLFHPGQFVAVRGS